MKTSELTGAALDWAVAIAEGFKPSQLYIDKWPSSTSIYTRTFDDEGNPDGYMTGPDRLYSRKWEAGGPIIERGGIELLCNVSDKQAKAFKQASPDWFACMNYTKGKHFHGTTPLIAAMRCYVASKLGDDIEIPKELTP